MKQPSTSMFVLLARKAPVGVLIRRGPSSQTQFIKWNLQNDTFEQGQWFKGRVYERRCDLSPLGTLLIYFAATYKKPLYSWTAVSKPPWFSAIALWPKGDGWNGGGMFTGSFSIRLNHFATEAEPHPDFRSGCRKLRIESFASHRGEDDTVWHDSLARSGWKFAQRGAWGGYEETPGLAWKAERPDVWRKPHPKRKLQLEMAVEGIGERNGTWYVVNYRLSDNSQSEVLTLGRQDWADWAHNGDLVYTRAGRLFRRKSAADFERESQIADFSGNRFTNLEAPLSALKL
jgi:hypothetical protein